MAAVVDQIILDPEKSYEIVAGHPEEKEMPGARRAVIAVYLVIQLGIYLKTHRLGVLCTEANFKIGENERIPDISFVASERISVEGIPDGAWPIQPDLAVEIISPNDLYVKVSSKITEYLDAGVRQVWIVSPEDRSVAIHRSRTDVQIFASDMELASEDIFPGFRCSLNELFPS